MSGVDIGDRQIRKGAADAIQRQVGESRAGVSQGDPEPASTRCRARGSAPLFVSDGARVLGIIELKDIVKGGIKERFARAAPDGHQDGHDHRRQSADGGGDRGGGRRG